MKRNILIIGASGEIGRSIVRLLAKEDTQFILHYNENRSCLEEVLKEVNPLQILSVLKADFRKEEEIWQFIENIAFPVHAVIFAGGKAHIAQLQDTTETAMKELFHLHLYAPWMITKHLLPEMIQRRCGHIIFITSIWGNKGASMETIYSSVKGGQNSFIKALAKEVANSGVYVNGVSPGYIETKMNNHLSREEKEDLYEEIPLKRPGKAEEVAKVVQFLLSDASSYIQGEIIHVAGGWE
ncbi:MAG TPA: SDR family oxidoreductase [Bacillota bacterium]|nr:SDR family oxidoreductase [Bacillota bacterium]